MYTKFRWWVWLVLAIVFTVIYLNTSSRWDNLLLILTAISFYSAVQEINNEGF